MVWKSIDFSDFYIAIYGFSDHFIIMFYVPYISSNRLVAIRASHDISKAFLAQEKVIFSIFSKWDVDQAEIHVSILTIFDMNPDFESRKKGFRWYTSLFYIFPTCRRSISIKRTDSRGYTTLRSKVSAEKLKFDSATYTFKITMFICACSLYRFLDIKTL